ncbi:MAG: glycosyltransferase family 4 protein [Planctomycetes bacterium]|nr:glycosyltransferase family 4 protein [Planctomycetota bacterium]
MKVAYLAAGASGMYCGSCMHDNRLAATLIGRGREVVVFPLYTPLRTDESVVRQSEIYYGGINVYLQHRSALFRHTPRFVDRVLDSRRLLGGVGRFAAKTRPEDLGRLTVSMLAGRHGPLRKELHRLIRALEDVRPDLITLPNLMFVGLAAAIKDALGVPVVCTLSGEDVFLDQLVEPHHTEARELIKTGASDVNAFVALTRYYADYAARHYSLPTSRVHCVPMGIHADQFPRRADAPEGPFVIGYLARICHEKGLADLVEAFIELRAAGRECRLRAAGYLGAGDRSYLEGIRQRLGEQALEDSFEYLGEVTRQEKFDFLTSLHVFSVPAVQPEPKGFYCLEALACGVPIVQPDHGSFPEIVEATGGGLLYPPATPGALAAALTRTMDEPELCRSLGARGSEAIRKSFTAEVMADTVWALYERLVAARSV